MVGEELRKGPPDVVAQTFNIKNVSERLTYGDLHLSEFYEARKRRESGQTALTEQCFGAGDAMQAWGLPIAVSHAEMPVEAGGS